MKKTKCINCKHWNIFGGCFLSCKENEKIERKKLIRIAKGLEPLDNLERIPPKPPEELQFKDKSTFYRKDDSCEWYKFSLLQSTFNNLDAFINKIDDIISK